MTIDYHDFTTKDMPKKEREKIGVGDIWSNQAKCGHCNETIRSKNRHDFVTCSCGKLHVDGGSWYLRRAGDIDNYEELSENYDDIGKN